MADEQTDQSKGDKKPQKNATMHVKVHAPYKTYFDGRAVSVTAANDTGVFDVLAGHSKFITILNRCEVIIRKPEGGEDERISIQQGVMHVKEDEIVVFLDV